MDEVPSLKDISDKWKKLKMELEELHRKRQKEILEETTKKGIRLFMEFLYISNNKLSCFQDTLSFTDLVMKPVNVEERLEFILARPGLFPSYIQLCELMDEQEKLAAKQSIMKKASRPE